MYVAYLYSLNNDGLITEKKIHSDLPDDLKAGEKVITFYKEEVIFYNYDSVCKSEKDNEGYFLLNGELKKLKDERVNILKEKYETFLNTVYNLGSEYLLLSFREEPSAIKYMEYNFKDTLSKYNENFDIKYTKSNLTEEENVELLKKTYNEILVVLNDKDKPYSLSVERKFLNSSMTYILGDCIENEKGFEYIEDNNLYKSYDEETNTYSLDTAKAYSNIRETSLITSDIFRNIFKDKEIKELKKERKIKNEK